MKSAIHDWFEGTTHSHEVLLQTQDSCIRNTGNKTWIPCDDLGKKYQSCHWNSTSPPELKKVRQVKSNIRSLWVRVLLIRNTFLQSMWLTTITTGRFCSTWWIKSAKNVHSYGGTTTGSSSMTLYQHTLLCQCSSFWPLQIWLQSSTLIQHLIWPLLICSCFQEWNHANNYIIFRMFLKFRNNCWSSYIWLLRISSSSGRNFDTFHKLLGGKRWCGWLRHCATSRRVAGSIP
jgi:hypothetical protein